MSRSGTVDHSTISGYTLWEIVIDPLLRRRAEGWILDHLERGVFAPVIDRVFALDDIVAAHAHGRQSGQWQAGRESDPMTRQPDVRGFSDCGVGA